MNVKVGIVGEMKYNFGSYPSGDGAVLIKQLRRVRLTGFRSGQVAQLEDATDSKSAVYGFESHLDYYFASVVKLVYTIGLSPIASA